MAMRGRKSVCAASAITTRSPCYRDGEWAERGEITLEAAAKIIGVCNMTALRMLRRGDIKGRQACAGAPWVIKAADLADLPVESVGTSANTKSRSAGL